MGPTKKLLDIAGPSKCVKGVKTEKLTKRHGTMAVENCVPNLVPNHLDPWMPMAPTLHSSHLIGPITSSKRFQIYSIFLALCGK